MMILIMITISTVIIEILMTTYHIIPGLGRFRYMVDKNYNNIQPGFQSSYLLFKDHPEI